MAFQFSVNQIRPEGDSRPWPQSFYALKEHIKSVGWTVPMSSTGSGGTWDTADLFTSPSVWESAALIWIRLAAPDNSFELVFQATDSTASTRDNDVDIWYSENGFTEGTPSADTRPEATDEVHVATYSNLLGFNENEGWIHLMAEDEDPYRFWAITYAYNNTDAAMFALDYAVKTHPDDTNPRVFFDCASSPVNGSFHSPTHLDTNGEGISLSVDVFGVAHENMSPNKNSTDDLVQAVMIGSSSGDQFKGFSSLLYVPLQERLHGTTYRVNGQDHSYAKFGSTNDGLVVKWDETEPPKLGNP